MRSRVSRLRLRLIALVNCSRVQGTVGVDQILALRNEGQCVLASAWRSEVGWRLREHLRRLGKRVPDCLQIREGGVEVNGRVISRSGFRRGREKVQTRRSLERGRRF